MDPICGLVGGLELAETGEQRLPQCCRWLYPQKYPSRTDALLLVREEPPLLSLPKAKGLM